jgi:CheY-like chemotaxis protein
MGFRPEFRWNEREQAPGAVPLGIPVTSPASPDANRRRDASGARDAKLSDPQAPVPRILCVDDEPAMLKVLTRALEGEFEIVTANDPMKALVLLEHGMDFSVVISDMKMPQMDGAEFLARVRRIAPTSTRLALTACLERELSTDEVFGILTKPCPLNLLQASVQAAVDHHTLQALLQRSSQPVPAAAPLPELSHVALSPLQRAMANAAPSIPRREVHLPGARASLQDPDPTLVLPHLAFDPWNTSYSPGRSEKQRTESESPRLSMLAGVAEKFFRLGQGAEAERILRPALWDLMQRCEVERSAASEREIELAGKLALRLAEDTESAQWIDYIFRIFTSLSRPLSTDLIEHLHDLVRRVPHVSRSAFQRYLMALRACRHEFGPGEHFLVRRIEGLEPLISP